MKKINIIREEVTMKTAQKEMVIASPIYMIEYHSKEYTSLGDLAVKKVKKVVFGKEEIDNQEERTIIAQKNQS